LAQAVCAKVAETHIIVCECMTQFGKGSRCIKSDCCGVWIEFKVLLNLESRKYLEFEQANRIVVANLIINLQLLSKLLQ